jgi:SAM-dependent methyltransferase
MLTTVKRIIRRFRRAAAPPRTESVASLASTDPTFLQRKARKLQRIRPLLEPRSACVEFPLWFDGLTDELRSRFHITDTNNVSSHDYDGHAQQIVRELADGLILDCGAGLRRVYVDNVVNFEICPYESTDVRGVGEQLPFRDAVFDAVFSFSVLEHVQDPFSCAREIIRVLKPGGRLYCVAPFLQPFHAYPHHYHNMTREGLRGLFEPGLQVEKQEVNSGGLPIWTLCWILNLWAEGLSEATRERFLRMRVIDLMSNPLAQLQKPFVTELSQEKNFELACATSLFARKPMT